MPQPRRWDKVKQIFLEAAELRAAERAAFLDRACEGDASLKAEVARLLEESEDASTAILTRRTAHTLENGSTLGGRFRITRFIGRGGMGEVYEAADLELGGAVGLKIVRPDLLSDPEFLTRFRREVQLARQVTHPNVCRVFDVGRDDDRVFFTMELLEGETLGDHLRGSGKLEPEAALPLARQMADGLAALHERGIVHRDFKPGNVMVVRSATGGLRAVIGDFGLARTVATGSTVQSQTSAVAGTPDYMAPEQLLGKPVTPASDLYAFGVVLYEMVAGAKPFRGGQAIENAVQRVTEQPTPPRRHSPALPKNWEATILSCLARAPEDRPADAAAVIAGLTGDAPARAPRSVRKQRYSWFAAAAVVVCLLLATGLWLRLPGEDLRQVAVLPFKVLGTDAELQVFADGLMEAITSRLSQYEGSSVQLIVVPASEVRLQKAASAADARIKFGASTAVEGSVQAQGNRVRLLLTVIDAKRMRQLGTVLVEEQRSNAVSLQDAAVTKLAIALNVTAQPRLASEMQQMNPVVPGAYEYYLQARGYLQRNDQLVSMDNAIATAQRALSLDPGYALAYSALGLAYWNKYEITRDPKFIEQAIANGRKGVELNGGLPETNISMGRVHLGTGRNQEALADFEKAIALDGQNAEAYQGLAFAYASLKQFDKAEATYRRAISMRPGDWNGYRYLGLFYYRRAEYSKSLEQYEHVIRLSPDNALGYMNLGVLAYFTNDVARARKSWERALEIDPGRVGTLGNLAKLESDEGNAARALELYHRAAKLSPRNHLIWNSMASAYKRLGDQTRMHEALDNAIRLVESEIQVNPSRAIYYTQLAHYRAMKGQSGYEELIAKGLAMAPEDTEVMVDAAETWILLGQDDRTVELLNKALANGYSYEVLKRSRTLGRLAQRLRKP